MGYAVFWVICILNYWPWQLCDGSIIMSILWTEHQDAEVPS